MKANERKQQRTHARRIHDVYKFVCWFVLRSYDVINSKIKKGGGVKNLHRGLTDGWKGVRVSACVCVCELRVWLKDTCTCAFSSKSF